MTGITTTRTRAALVALAFLIVLPAAVWATGQDEGATTAAAAPAAPVSPALDCMSCHGSTGAKYPLLGAKLGYDVSGHATLGDARYANAGGCQRCHTNEGYIEYQQMGFDPQKYDAFAVPPTPAGGTAPAQPYIAYPSQPGCFTCHDSHTTGDFILRTQTVDAATKAVTNQKIKLYNGVVYDGGAGNLCASCHQVRGTILNTVANAKGLVSARGTSHHGPEADMLAGTNGYEYAGKKYGSSPHYALVKDTCVTCHMEQPKARFGFSPAVGGHSFNVVGDVHEVELGNVSNCLACHGKDVKSVPGEKIYLANSGTVATSMRPSAFFNLKAKADYDGDGAVEFVQQEIQGLLERMSNKAGTGALQKIAPPIMKPDSTFAGSKATYTNDQIGAYQNYLFVLEDKSLGVHNTVYAIQLLMDSIQALDPTYTASARP